MQQFIKATRDKVFTFATLDQRVANTNLQKRARRGVGGLLKNRRSARVRSEGLERSNPETGTVFGPNPHHYPRTPAGANRLCRHHREMSIPGGDPTMSPYAVEWVHE